jgi:NAD-dependent SIR2 family protein deacetylase
MPKVSDAKKTELLDGLIADIERTYTGEEPDRPDLGRWVVNHGVMLDGKQFTFKQHEYLIAPYSDTHPFQVEIKAAQLGLTSHALLRVMHGSRYGKYRGILYLFPSRTDVTELSKSRLDPLIEDNPDTIGQWLRSTDSANVKKVWNSFLYLRGMRSAIGLKSIPVDFIVFDELDEAPQKNIDMAMERMGHSEIGEVLSLSNPTMPDYGIDALFSQTDQQYWLLRCQKCNHRTNLVDVFMDDPDKALREVKDRVFRACQKCGAELNPSVGEWVAKRPHIKEKRGRQFSQLYSQAKAAAPANILEKFRTAKAMTNFYNLVIGVAYVDAQNRLSVQEVLNCCGTSGMVSDSKEPTFMGVDQGDNLHVVIGKRHQKKAGEIIHIGEYAGNRRGGDYSNWTQLDELMTRFKVSRCVVDALPETKAARAFAERFPGRVFICFFQERQKGSYQWNEQTMMVKANRTEAMDASHRELSDGNVVLPRQSEILEEFAKHCHHTAKRLEEDEETGEQRYVYLSKVGGPDHYRLAYCYEAMARQSAPELLFPKLL